MVDHSDIQSRGKMCMLEVYDQSWHSLKHRGDEVKRDVDWYVHGEANDPSIRIVREC